MSISPNESLYEGTGVTFALGVSTGDRWGISSFETGEGLNELGITLGTADKEDDLDHEDIPIHIVLLLISLVFTQDSFIITVWHF